MVQQATTKVVFNSNSDEHLYPFEWYEQMQRTSPIYEHENGPWSAFRYEDVKRVMSEHETFTVMFDLEQEQQITSPIEASILYTDPPKHRQLRALVSQAFTPRRVASMEDRITRLVEELLGNVRDSGRMDIVDDLAYPLPVIVIAEMLGIPTEDRLRFKQWSDALISNPESDGTSDVQDPQVEMGEYFAKLIEARRREPREDLITSLVQAQVDGEHLTLIQILGFCVLLLVAGNETTTNLIGNAALSFCENPGVLDQLYANPALIPSAIEEALRYRSPVRYMTRRVKQDTVLSGQPLKRGDWILAWMGAANRDPEQFPNPEQFLVDRSPNRHIAFGHGVHFCLGAPLARLEARIALSHLLAMARDLEIPRDTVLEPIENTIVHGVKHLPVTFAAST